jgi:hypothetical protein
MIGEGYWSTGIVIGLMDEQWNLRLEFFDDGWCDQKATEGTLKCRYLCDDLEASIDLLKADAERLGIGWRDPTIYYRGDGESPDWPAPPDWREILAKQCARLGWRN